MPRQAYAAARRGTRALFDMTSLEGAGWTGARAAALETLMLASSHDCPVFTAANGPVGTFRSVASWAIRMIGVPITWSTGSA